MPSAAWMGHVRGRGRGELPVVEHPSGAATWCNGGVTGGDLVDLCFRLLAIGFSGSARLAISSADGGEVERRIAIKDVLDEAREKATAAWEAC